MFCMFPDSKSEWKKMGNRSEFHLERYYYLQNWYFSGWVSQIPYTYLFKLIFLTTIENWNSNLISTLQRIWWILCSQKVSKFENWHSMFIIRVNQMKFTVTYPLLNIFLDFQTVSEDLVGPWIFWNMAKYHHSPSLDFLKKIIIIKFFIFVKITKNIYYLGFPILPNYHSHLCGPSHKPFH